MPKVHVLSAELASQIAAGEVVERPASAAKELIENSLDAGATRVDVAVDSGGIGLLSVSDDGSGMPEEDARLSVERHATSKLASLADLGRVTSFGFRGEALPSIASVSRFLMRTRNAENESGCEVLIEGGAGHRVRPVGMPIGTLVEVRDLFFNVPARRKFLRSTGTEAGHVVHTVQAAALARPGVTFTVKRDGKKVRELLRASNREDRVRQAIVDEPLAACRGERGPLRVEAFLSRPERARSGAAGLEMLVNDRPVRDRSLLLTIAQSYGSVLERGRYPRGVVYLDLPPELVDVNVHPQKSEVRFADPRALSDALYGILSRQLASAFSLPSPERAGLRPAEPSTHRGASPIELGSSLSAPSPVRSEPSDETSETRTLPHATSSGHAPAAPPSALQDIPLARKHGMFSGGQAVPAPLTVRDSASSPIRPRPEVWWSSLRFIAQLRQTFLLCEGPDGLYVLDQHAAAERVTFTRLRAAYQSRSVPAQTLLFPVTFEVTAEEATLLDEHSAQMAEVGLDVRVRGEQIASVHAVPKLLQRASAERLVRDLLSEVSRTGGRGFSQAVDLAIATMACHGSIRAGDPLSTSEAHALLNALDDADFAGHCPHGRPVVTFTSWAELERRVGRR